VYYANTLKLAGVIQLINFFNNSYLFLWDGCLARPGAGKMPTPQEVFNIEKTAVSFFVSNLPAAFRKTRVEFCKLRFEKNVKKINIVS
jgi:hypothetical protein